MLGRLSLIVAVCLFSSSCFGGERWDGVVDKTRELTADAMEEMADGLEWAAQKLNEGANNIKTDDKTTPYSKLATALCEELKQCDHQKQTTIEEALHQLMIEPDEIETILTDLNNKDYWSVLLSFVDNSPGSAQAYLEEITDFDKTNLNQIVGEQRKLRQAFEYFQDVTLLSFDTAPDSAEYPVLSFVYQVIQKFPKMSEKTTLQEENRLPFFRNNDVERVKFLKSVIKSGQSKKLIDDGRPLLFDALCQLSDKERVEALYDRENRIKKLCIVPDKNDPTLRQCERLKTEDQKKQAEAFLDLREKLLNLLSCKL
ncbi:MAG: hypothetical protein DRR16_12535 [Candidatus Parabeggiatoa sp. nov. 3]|nr:MAG: hypothetical protein DRR00_18855 [Gammaproteobacteria bacterium]RKZ57170.1 MAG: hypothetical protein DRQ99_27355 [Gammaproteobacteria bacterium]RKZ85232.1 MAG: hypothetical protein DRR16_12535 [Gammaproteobacteria bacterium]HEW98411.1 hypothetical protein [Beggiatoa sp.]